MIRRIARIRREADERGMVIIFLAITLTVLMAAASFAVDLGEWYVTANDLQRAADAAALAGVVYMPNDFAQATTIALDTAAGNGFKSLTNCTPNGAITVCVSTQSNIHQLKVTVSDTSVQQTFSGIFVKGVTATRSAVAQYDLPIPLGSPENSLGTGSLQCAGQPTKSSVGTCIRPADVWLSVNGFCASREEGDLYASYYDANYSFKSGVAVDCPLASDRTSPAPTTEYANTVPNGLYRFPSYTYDVEVPGSAVTGKTTDAFTVQIYDPGFYDNDANTGSTGDNQIATDPLGGDQQTLQWQLWQPGRGAPLDHTNDTQLGPSTCTGTAKLAAPCVGAFASGPSHNLTAIGGCANAQRNWCTLSVIPTGSPAGQYQLTISSQANQASSNAVNNFALRAWDNTASSTFVPCANIAETDQAGTVHAANTTTCPEVHGDDAMSLYVDGTGATTYRTLTGSSTACHFQNTTTFPSQLCTVFFIAGIAGSSATAYGGQQMQIQLFDPGEGATGIHIIQPDGTLAQLTYTTNDASVEGPNAAPPLEPTSPNPGTGTCVCDTWQTPTAGNPSKIGPGNLPGRQGTGQYNDRILDITLTIPTGLPTTTQSWYQVEYDYSGTSGAVTDRTTWTATVVGNPVHLAS